MGLALVDQALEVGVRVPGGTYSRLCSLFEPMISRFDGVTDLQRPRD